MKAKKLLALVVLILLISQTTLAQAQGPYPPEDYSISAMLPKETVITPLIDGADLHPANIVGGQISTATGPSIPNGDFEQGLYVGWREYSSRGWPLILASSYLLVPPHSGNWAVWLGGDDNEYAQISQYFFDIVNPDHLRLWYWIASQDTCGNDFGFVKINDYSGTTTIYQWALCFAMNTNGWRALDLDLSAYSGRHVELIIGVSTNGSLNSNLFIDDVYFYRTFADVPFNYWSEAYINSIYTAGITGGCAVSPLTYCPATPVTRAQMAVFLTRAIHGNTYTPPSATGGIFGDVPSNYWAGAWIKQLATEGITAGCGEGNYCPETVVTRAQMAVFLLKSKYGASYMPPPATGTKFADVPLDYWAASWIEQLAYEGITGGCGEGNYCPDTSVTRDQMAVFLQHTFNLPMP